MDGLRRGQARYDAGGTPSIGKRIPWQIHTFSPSLEIAVQRRLRIPARKNDRMPYPFDSEADLGIRRLGGVMTMLGGVKLIDSALVIVLQNGEQEIERELAS
jgi:hypothetical protein